MEFPFVFGKVVTGSRFINRAVEIEKLKTNIEHGIHTVLISPRRWGKSSLVKRVGDKLSGNKELKFVFIDFFRLLDEREFYEEYSKSVLKAASSRMSEITGAMGSFFKKIRPGIKFGDIGQGEFNISIGWEDIHKNYDEILDLPEKLAIKRNEKWIICIDEFQSLGKFKDPGLFLSRLRSLWQYHTHVVYILYGSKRHMMNEIFNTQNNPFFRFGELVYLQKIEKEHFKKYIISTFRKSGKTISGSLTDKIIELTDNNPYQIQQLSRYVWLKSEENVEESDIYSALDEIILQSSVWYMREAERLTPTQFNFLKAVINEEKKLSSGDVIGKYKLGTSANVAKIKKILEEREILDFWNPYPEFMDPFFKFWIKKYYAL